MVSIQYGGGPTLEQRQKFCNLRPGSHIPGYLGFVPQVKFDNGKTYGKETHDVARKLPYYSGPKNQNILHLHPGVGPSKDAESRLLFYDEVPLKKLPKPTGDNKYTEKMMPGYSGDIPRQLNRFGATYRQICDDSIHEFIEDYERNQMKSAELFKKSTLFPKLRPIAGDPRVRDHMNLWTDNLLKENSLPDRKTLTEPPMPGYTGYIPRFYNTELGLASRYHVGTQRSLEAFRDENNRHFMNLDEEMAVQNNVYTVADKRPLELKAPTEPRVSRRIFNKDGMLPAYEGHVHRVQEEVGHTTGDATRNLEVCRHDFTCYGEYVKNKDLAIN